MGSVNFGRDWVESAKPLAYSIRSNLHNFALRQSLVQEKHATHRMAHACRDEGGNDAQAAQVPFEFVSARDPEYTLSSNSGAALIEEIMMQRRIELWGEGFRFYDLKRLNLPLDRAGTNHVETVVNGKYSEPAGTNAWQWQIPIDELNANENMVQNPS